MVFFQLYIILFYRVGVNFIDFVTYISFKYDMFYLSNSQRSWIKLINKHITEFALKQRVSESMYVSVLKQF